MVGRQVLKRLKELDPLRSKLLTEVVDDTKQRSVGNRFSALQVEELGEEDEAWQEDGEVQSQEEEVPPRQEQSRNEAPKQVSKAPARPRRRKRKEKHEDLVVPDTAEPAPEKREPDSVDDVLLPVNVKRLNHHAERIQNLGLRRYATNKDHSMAGAMRRNQLVSTEGRHFPAVDMVMNCVDNDRTYKYEHLNAYKQVEQAFIDRLSDPSRFLEFIQVHMSHANSVLQLSEIFATTKDYETATYMIEQCIGLLQNRLHPHFQLQCDPNAKPPRIPSLLPYRFYENRVFHIAVFRHALFLHNRAFSRTALEMAKVLLNADPTDPLAVVLLLDLYAIRANECQFLISFYEQYRERYMLDNLPGMAFHYALALFKRDRHEQAKQSMRWAISRFPSAFQMLLDRLSVKADAKMEQMLQCVPEDPTALKILNHLFVGRIYRSAWDSTAVLQLMEQSAQDVVFTQDHNLYTGTTPDRVRRHVALCGLTSDANNKALQEMLTERSEWSQWTDTLDPLCIFNPFPPMEDLMGPYTCRKQKNDQSLVAVFLRSILPYEDPVYDRFVEIINVLRGSEQQTDHSDQEEES